MMLKIYDQSIYFSKFLNPVLLCIQYNNVCSVQLVGLFESVNPCNIYYQAHLEELCVFVTYKNAGFHCTVPISWKTL